MPYKKQDIEYMQRAIALAKKGAGFVNPNPMVGCVVVKDNEIITEGYHEYYGGLHAERNALTNTAVDCKDATLYVTLEPCCHHGKTPPCTDIIIEKGIKKVVVGLLDPNPLVAGKGISILQDAGIEIVTGIEEDKIKELNKVFLKYIKTKRPYVILKTAMTLDGKIASHTGDSKWITNEKSRQLVHKLRSEMMGIVAGIGTVKADNPMLNCRLEGQQTTDNRQQSVRQPIRIIVDTKASISLDSNIVKTANEYRTILAIGRDVTPVASEQTTVNSQQPKADILKSLNVEILQCEEKDGHVDINDLMIKLGQMGIDSLLLEGGSCLNAAFLEAGCVDEVYAFIAPKIIGGEHSKSPIGGKGIELMRDAITFDKVEIEQIENDILIKGRITSTDNGQQSTKLSDSVSQ
ncbi:MAG: bifunctional diaminohydroxyphosphoribosylaminopyrimidine deaminase/5-amino-6-(5-phosphoribosylamino)uracil reductase RibD [Bacteroidales bacterium]|nr:bifunctional diaminohydroxyphosphoribosylaminopyrimidine deaminase/5-amino-6-(5-phosphoribosylamino)uracil reductase RibD [Bacteroidales bacterium]